MSVAALVILGLLTAIFAASVTVLRAWDEEHHFYWGAALVLAGWILEPARPWVALGLEGIGLAILADDALQHLVQAWELRRRGRVMFYSPAYRAYVAVCQWLARNGTRWEHITFAVRVLAIAALLWIVAGCSAGSGTWHAPSAAVQARGIPLEVENQSIDDVTVYVATGPMPLRIGRAIGAATTQLEIPSVFLGQAVVMSARFPSGTAIHSARFILPREGVTMTIAPADVRLEAVRL